MSKLSFQTLMDQLNGLYPPHLAEDWDKIGLHFGDPNAEVKRIMTTLDIRHAVVDEAITNKVDTIIVHHPILFKPIQRFDLSNTQNQIFEKLIKNDIKVFAMHTNLDIAFNGMNDWLAEELGLIEIRPLERDATEESPGLGRIGNLPEPLKRDELLKLLKKTYHRTQFPVIEKEAKELYQRIAIIGGGGSSWLDYVKEQEVDVFLTGDISYHTAQACEDLPIMTVDVGHYTENIFAKKMAEEIDKLIGQNDYKVSVISSKSEINPFKYE